MSWSAANREAKLHKKLRVECARGGSDWVYGWNDNDGDLPLDFRLVPRWGLFWPQFCTIGGGGAASPIYIHIQLMKPKDCI